MMDGKSPRVCLKTGGRTRHNGKKRAGFVRDGSALFILKPAVFQRPRKGGCVVI